jgi:hypothetical protein
MLYFSCPRCGIQSCSLNAASNHELKVLLLVCLFGSGPTRWRLECAGSFHRVDERLHFAEHALLSLTYINKLIGPHNQ